MVAARREPGPAARDAGAEGTVLCRDLPGGHRPRERVGARMAELRCQTVGPWRLPEWGSGAAHTPVSSAGSCAPHEAGIAAFMEKRANREHMRWVGVGSGFRTRLVFLIRQCWWCLLRKGLWGRGDVLTFCWCCWNARNPPTSQLSAKGEPEHGAWTASQHISAGFPMPS